jgi:hypothetical protein
VCRRLLAATLVLGMVAGAAAGAELADPTRPAGSRVRQSPSMDADRDALTLQAVVLSGDQRAAVINGRRVTPGEWVFGARVIEIGLTGVRLRREGEEILLTLTGFGIKRPSPEGGGQR